MGIHPDTRVTSGLATDPDQMCQIASKFPSNPWILGTSSREMLWSAWHLPPWRLHNWECLLSVALSLPTCSAGAIVAVYVVCWMPYHVRRLMYCYVSDDGWTG